MNLRLKNKKDLAGLRASGKILKKIMSVLARRAKIGTRLIDLDRLAKEIIEDNKAQSAFFRYRPEKNSKPFPAFICASINDAVVHGIPNFYVLKKGDLLKIDLGIKYQGYITDAAKTLTVGSVTKEANLLIRATKEALEKGVGACRVKNTLGDIGYAIEKTAKKYNVSVIRRLGGHGVGFELHEEPTVYNFGAPKTGLVLEEGMVLALEPMFCLGSGEITELSDGSFVTADNTLSAHFEHTVAITKKGPRVLTK